MRRQNVFWGIVLVLIGALFLTNNYGLFKFQWGLLWPLFLILIGLSILFGRYFDRGYEQEAEKLAVPLDGAKQVRLKIEHGAGRLQITGGAEAGTAVSGLYLYGTVQTRKNGDELDVRLRNDFNSGMFWSFPWNWGGYRNEWKIALPKDIPVSLQIDSGAMEGKLDLRTMNLTKLRINTGASSTDVILPEAAGFSEVTISSGAASHSLTIPSGVAADIQTTSGFSGINIDQKRFPRSGSHYTSPDYASAKNKVEIRLETAMSSVTIK